MGLWPNVTFQSHKSSSGSLKLAKCIQIKDGKLRLEFMHIIRLGKQILRMPSAKRPVLPSSLCTYHLFRCSICTLRFTFYVYIVPSVTAHISLQWDLLSSCVTAAWIKRVVISKAIMKLFPLPGASCFQEDQLLLVGFQWHSNLSQWLTSCFCGYRSDLESEGGMQDGCSNAVLRSFHLCWELF